MHLTILSAFILVLLAVVIIQSVIRGRKKGFSRSVISIAVLLISAIISAVLVIAFSGYIGDLLSDIIADLVPKLLTDAFPSAPKLAVAAVKALMSPVLFVLVLLPMRLIVHLAAMLITYFARKRSKKTPGHLGKYKSPLAKDNPSYSKPDAPWYIRHDKALGGAVRGLCGFLAFLMITCPIVGTVTCLSNGYNYAQKNEFDWEAFGIDKSYVEEFEPIINDAVIATLSASGGQLIFNGVSTTVLLEERRVCFGNEFEACVELLNDVYTVFEAVSSNNRVTKDQRKAIAEISDKINASDTTKLLSTDFLTGLCKKWLNNKDYMGLSRPANLPTSFDDMIESMLKTCAASTTECVGRDVGTILNIYLIFKDSGLDASLTEEEISRRLEGGEILDKIHAEMAKNPCMDYSNEMLLDANLILMSRNIDLANLTQEDKRLLMQEISNSLNEINADNSISFEKKVEQLTQNTIEAARQYGVELPDNVSEMGMTSLLHQLSDKTDYTPEELERFFEYYSDKVTSSGGVQDTLPDGGDSADEGLTEEEKEAIKDILGGLTNGNEQ